MLRKVIDTVTQVAARTAKGRCLNPPGRVNVNLGAGLAVVPGWINVDASINALFSRSHPMVLSMLYRLSGARQHYTRDEYLRKLRDNTFVFHDLRYGIPLPDESANFVYSSHFLEHLSRHEGEALLGEAFRVLVPGGVVRIVLPNLEYVVELYRRGEKDRFLSYFFSDERGTLSMHRYMYDYSTLESALRAIGFGTVVKQSYRAGLTPDIVQLDNRPDESLYVEAVK